MATEADGFFSRWSRRKAQATATPPAANPAPATPTTPAALTAPTAAAAPVAAVQQPASGGVGQTPTDSAAGTEAPPPPTLEDAARLTPESDFKPFVGRSVAPEVKNAAMKKLFADPHFNVMDGLDIYIDDYSKPDPLPAEWLKKMVGAQFMKLVDEDPPPASVATSPEPLPAADPPPAAHLSPPSIEPIPTQRSVQPTESLADSPAESPVQPSTSATTHDHPDLQLQPNHAAGRGGTGSGAG